MPGYRGDSPNNSQKKTPHFVIPDVYRGTQQRTCRRGEGLRQGAQRAEHRRRKAECVPGEAGHRCRKAKERRDSKRSETVSQPGTKRNLRGSPAQRSREVVNERRSARAGSEQRGQSPPTGLFRVRLRTRQTKAGRGRVSEPGAARLTATRRTSDRKPQTEATLCGERRQRGSRSVLQENKGAVGAVCPPGKRRDGERSEIVS